MFNSKTSANYLSSTDVEPMKIDNSGISILPLNAAFNKAKTHSEHPITLLHSIINSNNVCFFIYINVIVLKYFFDLIIDNNLHDILTSILFSSNINLITYNNIILYIA